MQFGGRAYLLGLSAYGSYQIQCGDNSGGKRYYFDHYNEYRGAKMSTVSSLQIKDIGLYVRVFTAPKSLLSQR
jgi:hypothetical protein